MLNSSINIMLADDHLVVRGGVKAMLEKEKEFKITGEGNDGAEVLLMLKNGVKADIILVDLNMPIMGGIELTQVLKVSYPQLKVIILSALDNEKYMAKAFNAGACSYLLKSISIREMVFAIHHTYESGQYICSELSKRFLNRLITTADDVRNENIGNIKFSPMEIGILTLISEGCTNQEVADRLFTSKRTIENHRQQLIDKTGSKNTIALIRFVMLGGVI